MDGLRRVITRFASGGLRVSEQGRPSSERASAQSPISGSSPSERASVQSSSSASSSLYRRLSPGEQVLEKTKAESKQQQAERTAAKVAELSNSARLKKARASISSGGRTSVTSSPLNPSRQDLSQDSHQASAVYHVKRHGEEILRNDAVSERHLGWSERQGLPSNHYVQAPEREEGKYSPKEKDEGVNEFPTAIKRNITSRKSRDRREDQICRQPQELLAKKPRERPQDTRYARESGNWEDLKLPVTQAVMQSPIQPSQQSPDTTTPSPKTPVVSFPKKVILELQTQSEIYEVLMDLYSERERYEEQREGALYDMDEGQAERYDRKIKVCNLKMHEHHQRYLNGEAGNNHDPPKDSSPVRDRPLQSTSQRNQNRTSLSGECPSSQKQFPIWLVCSGVETVMLVWDTMKLQKVFQFAYQWVVETLDLEMIFESMLLILRPDIHIHNSGCVYEVPIVENDVIDLHQDLYDSQIRRFPSQPPHRHQRESPSMVPAPNIFPSVEPSSGLDPRSYDRIRQNFKCPKFSGKPKDWKVWDKGLQRYLSIWELQHVLDADFLIMPLSQAHHRDNKLVYYIIEEAVPLQVAL